MIHSVMNISQAATYLGLSRPTLLKYLEKIPHRKVGRRILISRAALDTWLKHEDEAYDEDTVVCRTSPRPQPGELPSPVVKKK